MALTKDSVLWNGLPKSGNITALTFSEKIRNPLNLSLSNMSYLILRHFKNALSHCNIQAGPDITCQKNCGSLEGSNKSKKPFLLGPK
jgi:hypothetical protein